MRYTILESPVGPLLAARSEEGVTQIRFRKESDFEIPSDWTLSDAALAEVRRQLSEYFEGVRKDFDLPLAPVGTEFQRAVWTALQSIPYGHTVSYLHIAKQLKKPGSVRAVGAANGANPIPIVIPCHRVIGSDGSLTGYGGGLDTKKWLLALEGADPRRQPGLFP